MAHNQNEKQSTDTRPRNNDKRFINRPKRSRGGYNINRNNGCNHQPCSSERNTHLSHSEQRPPPPLLKKLVYEGEQTGTVENKIARAFIVQYAPPASPTIRNKADHPVSDNAAKLEQAQ